MSPSLRSALSLTAADRRWIDFLTQTINDTWDDANPQRPKTHGYMGSEEFIRLQFEEYLLALLSCMKYHEELTGSANDSGRRNRLQLQNLNIEGDPALEFNAEFLAQWQNTSNYALFKRLTSDALLFSIVEPRHPCSGGLTIDDVQRRLSQQVAELHLDEKVREGREALGKHLANGQKKVSAAFSSFWAELEARREARRKKNEEMERASIDKASVSSPPASPSVSSPSSWFSRSKTPSVDLAQAQASVSAVSQKAGSYFNSWSSWASERRREWQERRNAATSPPPSLTSPSTTTLSSVVEKPEQDRGRRPSLARNSEDLGSVQRSGSIVSIGRSGRSGSLARSGSRKKRWSTILRRKNSESESLNGKDDAIEEGGSDGSLPKSPLSKTFPAFPEIGSPTSDQSASKPVDAQSAAETQQTKTNEPSQDSEPAKTNGSVEVDPTTNDSSGKTAAEVASNGQMTQTKEDGAATSQPESAGVSALKS